MYSVILAILLQLSGNPGQLAHVQRVVDGDTVKIEQAGEIVTVRLEHIDAPERKQEGGQMATWALAHMIEGKDVTIVGGKKDRYGRLIGTIYVGEINVNRAMVAQGQAWWYARYSKDKSYQQTEQAAREAHRGLWSGEAVEPWVWRKKK